MTGVPQDREQLVWLFKNVRRHSEGERIAPHKPLLMLVALAQLLKGNHRLEFAEVERRLKPLLDTFAHPVKNRHQPELPYWHLRSDGIWAVDGADSLPLQKGGFPRIGQLKETSAGFSDDVIEAFKGDIALVHYIIELILDEYFPPTLHDILRDRVGLGEDDQFPESAVSIAREKPPAWHLRRYRDPVFRRNVLRAYGFRCVVTGSRSELCGTQVGCEAAHVRRHSEQGPDVVENGICVEPTYHMLFDLGAWSLTDDRRILVSERFAGDGKSFGILRERHGQRLRDPEPGYQPIAREFIEWHREPSRGGVFRTPAIPL